MLYPAYKWVDVAYGNVNRRNNVTEITKVSPPDVPDCYRTVYRYPDEFREHVRRTGSVRGYQGPAYADWFPIDIDDQDLEMALKNARQALNELLVNYEVDLAQLWCFFSGAKGFHILIPSVMFNPRPGPELPQVFKKMAVRMFQGVKLDPVIYDITRLFRLSNTKHSKTGLYKIPLEAREILHLSVDEIKALAREPRKIEFVQEQEPNEALTALYRACLEEVKAPAAAFASIQGDALLPAEAKLCYYKLLEGVGEGNRDNAALRLAVHFRKQGLPGQIVRGMLLAWNERNTPPMPPEQVEKVVRQAFANAYDFGCNDPVLREVCDEKCYIRRRQAERNRVTAAKVYSMEDARAAYERYLKELDARKIRLGVPVLDRKMRGIAPGEVCEIIARAGVGKTAFLMNIISYVALNQKVPILFFSMEQPIVQVFERAAQITTEMPGAEIEDMAKRNDPNLETVFRATLMNYPNVYVVDEDFLTYEELRAFVEVAERDKIGDKVRLICIDYLGRMTGEYGSAYEVTSALAKLVKRLAKDLDVAIIYLHQTSRAGKTGADPVTLDMARDSGVCEEAADFVLGLWRPDMDKAEAQKAEEEELRVAVLKNRKGPLCQTKLKMHKPSLCIRPGEEPPWP